MVTTKQARLTDVLRVKGGSPVDLAGIDPRGTPGWSGGTGKKGKTAARAAIAGLAARLSELQERLYAEGRTDGTRRLLLVVQGMDTSGKGGVMRHVVSLLDPQGVDITAFKAPTEEERAHDFLWRIKRRVPGPGMVGVFDRSHYEDVLIVRVHDLVPRRVWSRRYATINRFEQQLADDGCTVVKVMLHISSDEQRARLLARLDDPTKHWKFNPGDVDERARWDDYQAAYAAVLEKCSTDAAPWYVVPADRKWYRDWAVSQLLAETLDAMDPQWPKADFDVAEQRRRLLAADPR